MKLFDSAFSPFARKVRMVLELKGLAFEAVDGLLKANHGALRAVNGRVEVPALVDGEIVVANSADIVAYLEHRYPQKPVYPAAPAARVHARAWERTADTLIDGVLINVSYWHWAQRDDRMPTGLIEAARADMDLVYARLEQDLGAREFVCGELSIADIALFPHMTAVRAMGVELAKDRHPNVARWFRQMRQLPVCAADLRRAHDYVARMGELDVERRRIFWPGPTLPPGR